jgi:hypothetical protein
MLLEPPEIDPPGRLRFLVLIDDEEDIWYGVFQADDDALLGLPSDVPLAWSSADNRVRLWELGTFCEKLLDRDPEALAALWAPDEVIAKRCPMITMLRIVRHRFTSDDPPVDHVVDLLLRARRGELGGDR